MSAQVSHSHPQEAKKALADAYKMGVAGTASLFIGLIFIWIGPAFPGSPFYWVTAFVVVGITTLLLAPVVYFSKMELLEPENYGHKPSQ